MYRIYALVSLCCALHAMNVDAYTFNNKLTSLSRKSVGNHGISVDRMPLTSLSMSSVKSDDFIETTLQSIDKFFADLRVMFGGKSEDSDPKPQEPTITKKKIENAAIIFGATGKLGEEITKRMLKANPNKAIILTGRNESKLNDLFSSIQSKNVIIRSNVDVTKPETITADLFEGVEQVVCAIGPAFADFGLENIAEDVDYLGKKNIIDATSKYLQPKPLATKSIVSFAKGSRDISRWKSLNDVIMGGKSSSEWKEIDWNGEGKDFMRWQGRIITEGGGFAGTIANQSSFDITGYDGIKLRVRGDGKRYKVCSPLQYLYQRLY
jgi:hypothetical protein